MMCGNQHPQYAAVCIFFFLSFICTCLAILIILQPLRNCPLPQTTCAACRMRSPPAPHWKNYISATMQNSLTSLAPRATSGMCCYFMLFFRFYFLTSKISTEKFSASLCSRCSHSYLIVSLLVQEVKRIVAGKVSRFESPAQHK